MKRRFFILLSALVVVFVVYRWISRRPQAPDPHRYDAIFANAAQRYGVHPALVKAVAWQESRFDAQAKGGVGELGLMQLTDMASFEWADSEGIASFQPDHLLHPHTNAMAGAFYLSKMIQRYQAIERPMVYALADYNAGRTAVLGWMADEGATNSARFLEQMDYPGTRQYIGNVLEYFNGFKEDFRLEAGVRETGKEVLDVWTAVKFQGQGP